MGNLLTLLPLLSDLQVTLLSGLVPDSILLEGFHLIPNRYETKNCFLPTGSAPNQTRKLRVWSFRLQFNSLVNPLLWSHPDHARINSIGTGILLLQLMNWVNRLRYPRTQSGRRAYIQDSLKPYRCNFWYSLLIVTGVAGMIITLIMCFHGHCSFLLAIASMLLFLLGLQGIELNDKPHSQNEQEIQEMIERKRRGLWMPLNMPKGNTSKRNIRYQHPAVSL